MFFQINMKKVVAALLIILFPIFVFNMESSFKIASRPFLELSYGVQYLLNWVAEGVGSTTTQYLDLISIKKNNKNLLTELSKLKMKNVAYEELKLENERLKKMLDLKNTSSMTLEASTVISNDALSDSQTLTVSKGIENTITEEMGVIGLNGVIGRTLKVTKHRTQVLVLTDRFFVTEGLIQRSRQKLILEGSGDKTILAKHINANLDIQIGDLVVTSGNLNLFPKGLPVGVVENLVTSNAGLTKKAVIKPLTDLINVEELYIILNPGNPIDL